MCENRFIEENIFLFIIFHQIYMKKPKGVRLLTTVRHLTFLPYITAVRIIALTTFPVNYVWEGSQAFKVYLGTRQVGSCAICCNEL